MRSPRFPELLAASACALPMLLKLRNQCGDDPAKVTPRRLLVCVHELHAQRYGGSIVQGVGIPFQGCGNEYR